MITPIPRHRVAVAVTRDTAAGVEVLVDRQGAFPDAREGRSGPANTTVPAEPPRS